MAFCDSFKGRSKQGGVDGTFQSGIHLYVRWARDAEPEIAEQCDDGHQSNPQQCPHEPALLAGTGGTFRISPINESRLRNTTTATYSESSPQP